MREILFKAKRKNWRELPKEEWWVEGLPQKMWGEWHIISPEDENTAFPIDPETICQDTGATDKNGNKVWENNVVEGAGLIPNVYGVVKFGIYQNPFDPVQTEHLGFYVDWTGASKKYLRKDLGYWINAENAIVVGNIFDNADLIKGG